MTNGVTTGTTNGTTNGSSGQPTLEAVAARAGVGRGTVSRVINGSPQVSERTRVRVLRAVDELGYVPNMAARALVTRRTGAIALVISESEERIFGEPFFAGVVRGITTVVGEASRQLVLALVQTREQVDRLDSYLTPQHVDGVLMLSAHDADTLPGLIQGRGLPIVFCGRPNGLADASYVDVDNSGGARDAVAYLLSRGRSVVGHIGGPQDMIAGRDRLEGYRAAVATAGHEVDDSLVELGDFSEASGAAAMRALLARRPDVDAVFAASDPMALGALRVLREAGRVVPDDVALVGFDDGPLAEVAEPPLTTVHQPMEQLGREMATMLLAQIGHGDGRVDEQLVLDTELVERAST
ncbi:LacI family transcriptional regulator [Phycicoccus sp. Root563]|uniref:LacI family DNA-binding transcriptional regulator n=1 Tax=unclassified Phycicoccus TaxID=2637926 RepID=UPI000702B495|nr:MULTISPECIES: LacI family DNA-binding transcriptional regulator [unclassified Phycicoccus]KQU70380.1 LacI family transcriptional regulator [Phycicoccus sp. Root101]KQZ88673.1 LacI family transcriptional regulator [Phycicoccus sp. Root563]